MAIWGGHQGLVTIGMADLFDGWIDVDIYEWTFETNDPIFESTIFGSTPPAATAWVPGLPAFRGHVRGFLPSGVAIPANPASSTAFAPGRATSTLTLRHQDASTDFTISGEVHIMNPSFGVTIQGGAPLNTLEFDYQFDAVPTVAGVV